MYLRVRSTCASRIFSRLSSVFAASEVWMSPHFTIRGMVSPHWKVKGKLTITAAMKSVRISIILSLLCISAIAQVTVSPAVPVAGAPFDIRVEGTWRDSCIPSDPKLFIADKKLIATFSLSGGGGCLSAVSAYSATIHVPPLAAGTYQLSARLVDFDGPRQFFDKTIEISGQPSGVTSITSAFDTSAGNRVVKIRGAFPGATPAVLFGNKPAEAVERISDTEIHAVAPTQTHVSVVDVTIRGDGYNYVVPSGFTY